jgi:hypothetical protein
VRADDLLTGFLELPNAICAYVLTCCRNAAIRQVATESVSHAYLLEAMKKPTMLVLIMVALIGQGRGQERFKQRDQLCAYVQAALPWLICGYTEIISDPQVIDGRCPPWPRYRGSVTIRTAL